jgi:hypothetical protein
MGPEDDLNEQRRHQQERPNHFLIWPLMWPKYWKRDGSFRTHPKILSTTAGLLLTKRHQIL